MDSVGEGEGGKIWENGIETCKIAYMKRVEGAFKNPVSQVTSHIITVDSLVMRSRHQYFLKLFILFNFSIVDLQCHVNQSLLHSKVTLIYI